MQHNFLPSLLMLGGMVASFHYYSMKSGSCPIVIAVGELETGKSTVIRIAMSLVGECCLDKACTCLIL